MLKSGVKYCGKCALRAQDGTHCGITGINIDPERDFCSKFSESPAQCEICHKFIIGTSYLDESNGKWHQICGNCIQKLGTCHTCDRITSCAFEQSSSSLPKFVQKQVRQGNMVAMTQAMNPERVKITCEKGCPCFDKSVGCIRQNIQMCSNFKHTYPEV